MGKGGDRDQWARIRLVCLFLAVAVGIGAALPRAARGEGGLIGAAYSLAFDQSGDRTDEKATRTRALKHTLDVKYRGFLSPLIENEISVKFEQETRTGELTKIRVSPLITLQGKGAYWSMGVKRTVDDSNDPTTDVKTTDAFFMELFLTPARKSLPDLRMKYTLDQDREPGKTDTRKQAITASSVYTPADWLSIKGDYSKTRNDDLLREDTDTEEEKITGTFGIRRLVTKKIKLDAEYKVETTRGATLLSNGGATSQKEDQAHTVKSLLGYRPTSTTDLAASYDLALQESMVTGEHTLTRSPKVTASQAIGPYLTAKGDFSRTETETRHTSDDNLKTEDTWNAEFDAKPSKFVDLTLKRQNKHVREEQHADDTKNQTNTTITDSAAWNADLAAFWKASVAYDRTATWVFDTAIRQEVGSNVLTKYSMKSPLEFKYVNLNVEPSYDIAFTDDIKNRKKTETREVRVRVAWLALRTNSIEAKGDHTYDRKSDTLAENITRTDTTNVNIIWKEPFPGWTVGIDVTRTATDISEDDLPPDLTSSFGFKADYKFERFMFSTSEKYDKKRLTDSSANADVKFGWTAQAWNVTLTCSYRKTFSVALSDGYSISLAFSYNL